MFKRRAYSFSSPGVVKRTETVVTSSQEIDKDGLSINRVVYKEVDPFSDEAVQALPTYEDYSLSNLIAAGVPLDTIPVGQLLDPS